MVWLAGDGGETGSYMLRSLAWNNTEDPNNAFSYPYVDGSPDFGRFGWKNLNYSSSISASGSYETVQDCVDTAFTSHETDKNLHKYGALSEDPDSDDYVFGKLARFDVSNLKEDRENVFFPFQTGHFTTESVLNGIYRIWDNGLLEMDIVFRLGKREQGDGSSLIYANDRSFQYS